MPTTCVYGGAEPGDLRPFVPGFSWVMDRGMLRLIGAGGIGAVFD